MIGAVTPFQAAATAYAATPTPMRPSGAVAIEPVARAERTPARVPGRRDDAAEIRPEARDEAPARQQARDILDLARQPAPDAAARDGRMRPRPSAAFIAQAIAQTMGAAETGREDDPAAAQPFHPGRLVYRRAAERDTTYSGFFGPVDFLI